MKLEANGQWHPCLSPSGALALVRRLLRVRLALAVNLIATMNLLSPVTGMLPCRVHHLGCLLEAQAGGEEGLGLRLSYGTTERVTKA